MTTTEKHVLPYGSWPSAITASIVTTAGAKLGAMADYQGHLIATESRPDEAGRVVLVRRLPNGEARELLPNSFSVRTRVHEYGGAAWWVGKNALYVCQWDDQRLYRASGTVELLKKPVAITPEPLSQHGLRFADGVETPCARWVIAVCEMHGKDRIRFGLTVGTQSASEVAAGEPESIEPANVIVAIPTDGSAVKTPTRMQVLSQQADFVSNPRVSRDARRLSWLQWHHPNMPWDTTELTMADMMVDDAGVTISNEACVAGGEDESIVGPQWLDDDRLVFSSDRSGWWNLYALDPMRTNADGNTNINANALTSLDDAEIGAPAWAIGTSRFIELVAEDANRSAIAPWLAIAVTQDASDSLVVLTRDGQLKTLPLDCAAVHSLSATQDGGLLVLADFRDSKRAYIVFSAEQIDLLQPGTVLPSRVDNDQGVFVGSIAERVTYPSGGATSHAFFYPPTSPTHHAHEHEKPPLIVMGHGGPTGHSTPALNLAVQFWTSRGFAVADVNYRGSSGFGRRYRQALNESWGVVDVEDCISIARFLADSGRVDSERCVIRGGSAGGLTVLRALQLSDAFAAGTSLYGVADLEGLLNDTHKFESRYLDNLIGSYPEHKQRYRERSPIHHAADINAPLLVLQGDEDKVVPPSQSEAIVAAVAAQGLAHAYVVFEGEQHGWRKSATLVRALELELWFYGKALGFAPADSIPAPSEAVGF